MADFFLYGALRFAPLLARVLGRSVVDADLSAAELRGYSVFDVPGDIYPTLAGDAGGCVQGVLVRGLSAGDVASLVHFETGHAAAPQACQITAGSDVLVVAQVFVPTVTPGVLGAHWQFDLWTEKFGALCVRAAEEIMAWKGRRTAEQMVVSFPAIHRRASAWLGLQTAETEHPEHPLERDVIVHAHKREYINFFAMDEVDFQHRRFDGTMSAVMNRGVFQVGRAASILPYDPWRDQVLLIQQFRAAPMIAGGKRPWMWEAVAGLIDVGESPEQAAMREAEEEAGLKMRKIEPVAQAYSSSGSSSEYVHMFVGIGSLEPVATGGGLACEGEDIRHCVLGFDAFMDRIDRQDYQDMPLVTCGLWLARHRNRLRAEAN